MPRDRKIKRTFEIADDGIQGVFGYFLYAFACQSSTTFDGIVSKLPAKQIPIMHEWDRLYCPQDLAKAMGRMFTPYHARVTLIAIIGMFEAGLRNFIERLIEAGKINRCPGRNYKNRLEWAFSIAARSDYGTNEMHRRIPNICLDVDHARRLRNLWIHNNGLFDDGYADCIVIRNKNPILKPDFLKYQRDKRKKIPALLTETEFFSMYKSHVELLHHLHDRIQRDHFGQKQAYGYHGLKKRLEWERLLIGK